MRNSFTFSRPALPAWVAPYCGITGAGLFLSGVVCFFAYNWAALGLWVKFALPLAGLLLCGWGAYCKGPARGAGHVLSVSTGVFLGIFWAVYAQAYPTGAFAYEFFRVWVLCMLPLALLAGSRWLWLLWVGVASIYIICGFGEATAFWLFMPLQWAAFAAAERAYFKTRRMGWFSLLFLIPALGELCFRGAGAAWSGWGGCLAAVLLWAAYAFVFKRGVTQLGLCVFAADFLFLCKLGPYLRGMGAEVWILLTLLLFTGSAWGVYALTRRGDLHD